MNKKKIVVAVSGASGSVYAKVLFDKLKTLNDQISELGIIMSDNAKDVWLHELGNKDYLSYDFRFYDKRDFLAPFASGSAGFDTMIVCPCSMGILGRVANGISDDLITRSADVILKERRKLILLVRESPYNLIHINNMKTVTEAGGIICPATPSFYSLPKTIEEVAATVINRVIDLVGFDHVSYQWGKNY